jgi:hypothetical protein
MSRLLGRVRRKMLSEGLPAVLAGIGDAAVSARQHAAAQALSWPGTGNARICHDRHRHLRRGSRPPRRQYGLK